MRPHGKGGSVCTIVIVASVGCMLFAGCAAPLRDPRPEDYVFFSHYPELTRVPAAPGVFLYANPRRPIVEGERFIVNPTQIGFQPQTGHWLSPAQSRPWAEALRDEVIAGLSEEYEVVDMPAAGVLRVTLVLADIRLREPVPSVEFQPGMEYQPFLIMLISDSTTGEAVALLRDLNRGEAFATAAQADETAARAVLGDWARTLRARLEEAQGASPLPPAVQP